MDGKMKGMIMAGMMALSLILGAMAIFSNEWLTEEEDDVTDNSGLSNKVMVMDAGDSDTCDAMVPLYEAMMKDATVECDGAELTLTIGISDLCESLKDGDAESDDIDDCEAAASAGTMGQIGMWGGVVLALVATLMMVLPMAGVDAMDAIPEMGQKVISWGAGGLMLLGMVLWYFMLPDGDSSMGSGLIMAGAAMSIALGSTLIGQFIPADE
ncbi:hypothetical protein OAO34_01975 [Candidatus Poseidoniaceae archaeon]|nr:hypothetical protein [Candidatus Poseidoniaceae archaeon]